jgi:hypothetical protein
MTWLPHSLRKLAYDVQVDELVAVGTDSNPVEPNTSVVGKLYRYAHARTPHAHMQHT